MAEDRTKVVDELGEIHKRLAPYRKDIAREKAVNKIVRAWPEADKIAPNATKTYQGIKHSVSLGEAENERQWIATAKGVMFMLLRKAKFLAMCNVTLTAATEAVGESAVADLVVTERTGSRPLIVTERTK